MWTVSAVIVECSPWRGSKPVAESKPSVKITAASQGRSWAGAGRTEDQVNLDASYSWGSGTSGRAG